MPASHAWERDRTPTPEDTVPAEMERGSVLLYTGSVFHGGGATARLGPVRRSTSTTASDGCDRRKTSTCRARPRSLGSCRWTWPSSSVTAAPRSRSATSVTLRTRSRRCTRRRGHAASPPPIAERSLSVQLLEQLVVLREQRRHSDGGTGPRKAGTESAQHVAGLFAWPAGRK